ncbi:MAG: aminotransferase class III-fold pyridoxal phosphate-dependent enzyme [Gaiellales bacterium]
MAVVEVDPGAGEHVRELDRAHLIHSWSVQSKLNPLPIAGAEGCYFWDYEGKRYLDFASQLVNVNIGHQHPKVVQAIKDQADRLCTIGPPMANDVRSQLAGLVAEVAPGDLNHTFFANGGAEANENAIKLARWVTGRHKIVARYRSYHGATAGAITLTGDPRRWYAEPGLPGIVRMFDPYTYRCPAGHPDPCPVCTGGPHLEEILMYEGPQNVAAVIMETVTGTNGVIVPPPGYLKSIREVCDRHGILLILDEVMAGFGRTGKWFACEHWDVVPDIMTVAKGINSGYVPLGGMVVTDGVFERMKDLFFAGGLTYSGHPLACAAGVASIEAFREEGIVENAAAMGEVLAQELPALQARHPAIGEIRGVGLFWMLELVRDRQTKEMLVPYAASGEAALPMARLTKAALEKGLYLFAHFNRVGITPPLTITKDELLAGLAVLDEVLAIADEYTNGA